MKEWTVRKTVGLVMVVAALVISIVLIGSYRILFVESTESWDFLLSNLPTPTPFQPIPPTPVGANEEIPQPVVEEILPYNFDGVFFDYEVLDESSRVRIIFRVPGERNTEVSFLPVAHKDWMDADFGRYCQAGSDGKACVWDSQGVITILAHSGCFPKELSAEELRSYIYGGDCLRLFDFLSETEKAERIAELENSGVTVQQGNWTVDDLFVDYFGEVSFEDMDSFRESIEASHIQEYMEGKTLPERGLIIVSSVRDNRHSPYFSAGNFFLVLSKH